MKVGRYKFKEGVEHMNKDELLKTLGNNIKYYRQKNGWTLVELAKRCDWSQDTADKGKSTISKIEAGIQDIQASKIKTLAEVFGISPCDLLQVSEQVQNELKVCELFEKCYGSEAFKAVQQFLKLDDADRKTVTRMMTVMLADEKYINQAAGSYAG